MRNITLTLLLTSATLASSAQALDTLFFENFETWENQEIEDSIFKDYDADGLMAANGLPGGWFVANLANGGTDSLEKVVISASWLDGFAHGNRNWLILPPVDLADTAATLSWRSAPAVGDLYLDGYTVLISDNEWFYYDLSLCDTLMHFAQNINDNESDFSDGIVHPNLDYGVPMNLTSTTQYPGLLSQWSVDLSPYNNQTVYIGFLHNSDDDNYIALDDITVLGKEGSTPVDPDPDPQVGMSEYAMGSVIAYPTVVTSELTMELNEAPVSWTITNALGAKILNSRESGLRQVVSTVDFANGVYFLNVQFENESFTSKFIK